MLQHRGDYDDLPETIHQIVCGVAFIVLGAALLRWLPFWWAMLLFSIVALLLMFVLTPVSAFFYFRLRGGWATRDSIHVTDAGCAALIFVVLIWIGFSALTVQRNKISNPRPPPATTTAR